jgi:hypothetical protein
MALSDLLTRIAGGAVTSVTPAVTPAVTLKPLPIGACTPVTPVTAANDVTASDLVSWGWLIHYADRDPVACYFSPMVTHAEVMEYRPDAIAAEPIAGEVAI